MLTREDVRQSAPDGQHPLVVLLLLHYFLLIADGRIHFRLFNVGTAAVDSAAVASAGMVQQRLGDCGQVIRVLAVGFETFVALPVDSAGRRRRRGRRAGLRSRKDPQSALAQFQFHPADVGRFAGVARRRGRHFLLDFCQEFRGALVQLRMRRARNQSLSIQTPHLTSEIDRFHFVLYTQKTLPDG